MEHLDVERPRERMIRTGTSALSDEDLLALVLGTGVRAHSAHAVAAELVRTNGGLAPLSRSSPRELAQVVGVGAARAVRIAAAFELGRRAVDAVQRRQMVGRPEDIYALVAPRVAGLAQELFFVIGLDVRNGLLDIVEVARGSIAEVVVHPREVFRPLVRMAAAGAVLAHNHPTGDATPSAEDLALTHRLREAGALIGIPIVDHVVIGDGTHRSIAEWLGTEW